MNIFHAAGVYLVLAAYSPAETETTVQAEVSD